MDRQYIELIQKWVDLDNVIELKKTKLKDIQDRKKHIEEDILNYIEENDMQNLHINITDGHIKFQETKTTSMISQKYLKDMLDKFFESHRGEAINPKNIYDYLMKNREVKTKLGIKRQITS
jgi:hypothetical protein